jgi:hypothetical protein
MAPMAPAAPVTRIGLSCRGENLSDMPKNLAQSAPPTSEMGGALLKRCLMDRHYSHAVMSSSVFLKCNLLVAVTSNTPQRDTNLQRWVRPRKSGSHETPRWREMDSNL